MPTSPLVSARYPASSSAPNVNQDIQNAVYDLEDNLLAGPFATTTARDSAFSSWTALGNTLRDGLHCWVTGIGEMIYLSGAWTPKRQAGVFDATLNASNNSTGTLTFPTPFAAAPSAIILTPVMLGGTTTDVIAVATSRTAASFGWRVRERSGTAVTAGVNLCWVALP